MCRSYILSDNNELISHGATKFRRHFLTGLIGLPPYLQIGTNRLSVRGGEWE